jgi:hypothetical protein
MPGTPEEGRDPAEVLEKIQALAEQRAREEEERKKAEAREKEERLKAENERIAANIAKWEAEAKGKK